MSDTRTTGTKRRIVDAAAALLEARPFPAISAAEIARAAGVGKGTIFLHFGTKEALGLAVLGEMLESWRTELIERLRRLDPPATTTAVAAAIRRTLESRAPMVGLLSTIGPSLEANAGDSTVQEFRDELALGARRIADQLERLLPWLRPGEGVELAMAVHATTIGVRHLVGEVQRGGGADDGQSFRLAVAGAIGRTTRLHLEGMRAATTAAAPD